jgi:RNA exonuclease 4
VGSGSGDHQNNSRHNKNNRAQLQSINDSTMTAEEQDRYRALDCEMVGVGRHGHYSVLARVTIVDWHGNTVYDEFVQPTEHVTDYRTFVSGITQADLEHALDLDTCRAQVQQLIQNKILIGHALKNDLHALSIHHPWQQIRDTAKYEPFMQVRFDDGVLWPRKLRELVQEKLHRDIQAPGQAHSPLEDAVAALQLYKAVRSKWEKVMEYKIQKTAAIIEKKRSHHHEHHQQHHHPSPALSPTATAITPVAESSTAAASAA